MRIRKAPIIVPEPTAIDSAFSDGRTAPFSGMKPTSTMAIKARPIAMYPSRGRRSPRTNPAAIGTTADTTAVVGDRMLMGPIARHPYSSEMASAPVTPERPPSSSARNDQV